MKRVGLLLHPFYAKSIVKYTKELYKSSIKEYDTNIILSPAMRDKNTIMTFLGTYEKEIVDYIYKDIDSVIQVTLGDVVYDINISAIIAREYALIYTEAVEKVCGTNTYDYNDFMGVYLAMLSDDLVSKRQYTIFKGDIVQEYHKDVMEIIYNDLWIDESVAGLYHVGPMFFAISMIEKILKTHIDDKENTIIDIYGEYLNQCVLDMARVIRGYGYKINIISNKSIAYAEDNELYDSSYATLIDSIDGYDNEALREEFAVECIPVGDKKHYLIIDKELV